MQRGLCARLMFLLLMLNSAVLIFAESSGTPRIDRIEPPNWWPSLPNPMLLVYGQNLAGARFEVTGKRVSILKTQTSANGHYAFLWLSTRNSEAQKLRIGAFNRAGSTQEIFALKRREPARGRYQGFNATDVM